MHLSSELQLQMATHSSLLIQLKVSYFFTSLNLDVCTDMDTKNFQEQYEAACWKIVDEMQEKFIDLCVDDNHSAYGN